MTFTKTRFTSFEAYLSAEPSDLPEGRCEYWDGELVPVMTESKINDDIANYIFVRLQYDLTEEEVWSMVQYVSKKSKY